MTNYSSPQFQSDLRKGIIQTFGMNDIKILCADLAIDYEDLAGDSKEAKVLELILYMNRRGRTADLLKYCLSQRPGYTWPQAGGTTLPPGLPVQQPVSTTPAASTSTPVSDVKTILFLAADPSDASRLRLGEELRDIQERLQLAKFRDKFALQDRWAVRPVDVNQALHDTHPRIVHFSGHGSAEGAIYLEDATGHAKAIEPAALAALFELFADEVECVVLNACYSEIQAKAIATQIKYVIGMDKAIGDAAAIAFATGFYLALGGGDTIAKAYKSGCVQIGLQGIPEQLTPVLHTKGGQPPAEGSSPNP